MNNLMRRLIFKQPAATTALPQMAVAEQEAPALQTIPCYDCPASDVVDALPCERHFANVGLHEGVDVFFLKTLAAHLGRVPKYISWESLLVTRSGDLGLQFPSFAFIDPFAAHVMNDPATTCRAILSEWISAVGRSSGGTGPIGVNIPPGILMLYPPYHGGEYVIQSSIGWQVLPYPRADMGPTIRSDNFGCRGYYTVIPGHIPPDYRMMIHRLNAVAKRCGGDVRLIVEANWKGVKESRLAPIQRDPLLVIVKDRTIAYIDRFDCTAVEEHLAREHAVRVPHEG